MSRTVVLLVLFAALFVVARSPSHATEYTGFCDGKPGPDAAAAGRVHVLISLRLDGFGSAVSCPLSDAGDGGRTSEWGGAAVCAAGCAAWTGD